MTSRTPASAVIPASSSTRFSVAEQAADVPHEQFALCCSRIGEQRCVQFLAALGRVEAPVSTPRPHSQTLPMPWPSRPVAVTVDGASVRAAPLWMPRSHRQANVSPARPSRYARA